MTGKVDWRAAAAKAIKTGKMANTLAKALAQRYSKRWKFVDFLGPNGRESAGIVDILAIRKRSGEPQVPGLKPLDLFDTMLIQVKGGSAPEPSKEDIERLRLVAGYYHASEVILFQWKQDGGKRESTSFRRLDDDGVWQDASPASLFGR